MNTEASADSRPIFSAFLFDLSAKPDPSFVQNQIQDECLQQNKPYSRYLA